MGAVLRRRPEIHAIYGINGWTLTKTNMNYAQYFSLLKTQQCKSNVGQTVDSR